jgi:hypothetical protein
MISKSWCDTYQRFDVGETVGFVMPIHTKEALNYKGLKQLKLLQFLQSNPKP